MLLGSTSEKPFRPSPVWPSNLRLPAHVGDFLAHMAIEAIAHSSPFGNRNGFLLELRRFTCSHMS